MFVPFVSKPPVGIPFGAEIVVPFIDNASSFINFYIGNMRPPPPLDDGVAPNPGIFSISTPII